ncbi:hypothetical protein H310_13060 [Aphanomyces invadans]|uniref:Uncharacterized protein n=1 Tax=Aphanomyces invadans TaxID=157072 RepID=A0A024TEL1_9STRA|nr:hypothetical protein H310_13060 [Aphanomyces invadans]ETV92605.1 hypothetical protein H310_13060 [Aphanomyces invadans]|eukprot:XP_008878641.1 hypothetical protein H310_13060 [Aphanomyces invadans]
MRMRRGTWRRPRDLLAERKRGFSWKQVRRSMVIMLAVPSTSVHVVCGNEQRPPMVIDVRRKARVEDGRLGEAISNRRADRHVVRLRIFDGKAVHEVQRLGNHHIFELFRARRDKSKRRDFRGAVVLGAVACRICVRGPVLENIHLICRDSNGCISSGRFRRDHTRGLPSRRVTCPRYLGRRAFRYRWPLR